MAKKNSNLIVGLHPLQEAIESGKTINKIMVKKGIGSNVNEVLKQARDRGVFIQYVPNEKLNKVYRGNHQGIIAFASPVEYHDISGIVMGLFEEGKNPFIVLLDGVTDVRNFGAIARTAECAGVDAIVIPSRGSVFISDDAIKTSAGALHKIPVCKVDDLKKTAEYLKQSGISVVSVTEKAVEDYYQGTEIYSSPVALIMGSEEKGISDSLIRLSDKMIKIPMVGTIESLNVGVAFGIVAFEIAKVRK